MVTSRWSRTATHSLQVSATGADAFSRRKTQSKVYWSTIPKNKRDELEAAAAAAGTTVRVNADGTAMVQSGATGVLSHASCTACLSYLRICILDMTVGGPQCLLLCLAQGLLSAASGVCLLANVCWSSKHVK